MFISAKEREIEGIFALLFYRHPDNITTSMRQGLFLLLFLLLSCAASAQFTNPDCPGFEDVPYFYIDDTQLCEGENGVCLEIKVEDYVAVESFQFILSWNPNVLEYNESSFSQTGALGMQVFNSVNQSQFGFITIVYISDAETIVDGTAIFEICFDVVGEPGDCANFQVIGGLNVTSPEVVYGGCQPFNFSHFSLGDIKIKCIDLYAQISACHSNSGTGSITIDPCGGVPLYSYNITGPSTASGTINANESATEFNLPAGIYTVTLSDAAGNTFMEMVEIENSQNLSVELINLNLPICSNSTNGELEVAGNGGENLLGFGYEYEWSNGQYTPVLTDLVSTVYSVTVTDINGCTATDDYDLGLIPPIEVVASTTPDFCDGGVGTLTFSITGGTPIINGGYKVRIFQSATLIAATFGETITNLDAGPYEIEIEDASGCPKDTIVVVEEIQEELTSTTTTEAISCAGVCDGSFELTINQLGNFTFDNVVSPGSGTATDVNVVGNTITASNLCGGNWIVGAVDNDTSCEFDTIIFIVEPIELTVEIGQAINSTDCDNPDGFIFVADNGGTGDIEYTWSPNVNNTNTYIGAEEGVYTITVEDENGCTASTSTEIFQDGGAQVEITVLDGIGCNGSTQGTLSALPDGDSPLNYTFVWNNLTLGLEHDTGQSTNVDAGEYEVVMTHLTSSCVSRDTVDLFSTNDLTFDVTGTDLTCYGVAEGVVEVFNVVGGDGNYTVDWDGYPGQDGLILNGASAGIINFTVNDMLGCSLDGSYTLNQPDSIKLDINFNLSLQPLCHDSEDGVISIICSGGTAANGYNIDWPGAIPDETNVLTTTASGFGDGEYEVIVSDDNGCTNSIGFRFDAPDPITINENATQNFSPDCVGTCDGFVNLVVEGGTPSTTNFDYFIEWEDGFDSFERSNLCPDTYLVTVTDGNNCTSELTIDFELTGDTLTLEVDTFLTSSISCNSELGGQIVVNPEGGTGNIDNYSYEWTNAVSFASIASNLGAGIYDVTVTDEIGCTATTSFEMAGAPALGVDLFPTQTVNCSGGTFCLNVGVPFGGSGPPYLYQLNNQPPVLPIDSCITVFAGLYNLTIIDSENCILDTIVEVLEPTIPSVDLGGDLVLDLGDTDVIIEADFEGDEAIDSIIWTTIDTINCLDIECEEVELSISQDQQVSVLVTDINGCTAVDQISITVNEVRNVFLPTVFMPDLDTERTFMVHLGQGAEQINYFAVFDRWGNQVYRIDDVISDDTSMFGWTGRFNNQDAVEGVYVYIVEVLFSDGQVRRFTRDITLLR